MTQHLALQHGRLLRRLRVTQVNAQQEAIELRLGQRERAFILDRVLRRQHDERRRERPRHTLYGDLVFFHRLEQRRLSLGRRAVDLVGEHHVGHDRPSAELELARPLIVDRDTGHVRRQQIGRELDALERAARGARQTLGEHRFAHAGHVFDQQVPSRGESDDGLLGLGVLADQDLFDRADQVPQCLRAAHFGRVTRCAFCVTRSKRLLQGDPTRNAQLVTRNSALCAMAPLEFLARAARARVVAADLRRRCRACADARTSGSRGASTPRRTLGTV